MSKNYYDVDVKQNNGLFKTVRKNVSHLIGSKIVLEQRQKGNEAELCYGFHKYKIMSQNEIDFKEGAIITKENIHLYYEFMSDEDLFEHQGILNSIFRKRYTYIEDNLCFIVDNNNAIFFHVNIDNKKEQLARWGNCFIVSNVLFGIKDTLKPINEYIEEIKASSEYKEYIKKEVEKYYIENYGSDNQTVVYSDRLEFKENIHQNKIDTPFGSLYVCHSSPPSKGCKSMMQLRLKDL